MASLKRHIGRYDKKCVNMTQMPAQGPSSNGHKHFAKNEVEKRAITLIIIGKFNPKLNLTFIYEYIPVYKV